MGLDLSNVRKELYLISFYDIDYIIKNVNEYISLKIYDEIRNRIGDEFRDDEFITKTLLEINADKKFMKKAAKRVQKQSFAIEVMKDTQSSLMFEENIKRIMYIMSEVKTIGPEILNYYLKISHIGQMIMNTQQHQHIPFMAFKDKETLNFALEYKTFYGIRDRDRKNITHNIETENDDDFDIKKIIKRRFENMKKRCEKNNYPIPKYPMYIEVFNECVENGFNCFYCKQHMRYRGDKQQKGILNFEDMWTFEHREPLSKKGVHSRDNVVISCMSCNTIKGDMSEDTFVKLIDEISSDMKYKLYEEALHKDNMINSRIKRVDDLNDEQSLEIEKLKKRVKTLEIEKSQLMDKIR